MIENQTVPLNSVETDFSQMPDLLCDMEKVPFLCTERARVLFSGFEIRLGKILMWNEV